MEELDEIVAEFLVEGHESLDQLDRDLLALEDDPDSPETVASVFRTVHSIKGACGFLGFTTLERVTHVGEGLLARLRDGHLRFDGEAATVLLSLSDAIRTMLAEIEATGSDGDADHAELLGRLTALQDRAVAPGEQAAQSPGSKLGEILVERGIATPEQVAAAVARQLAGDARRLGEILVEHGVSAERIDEALDRQGEQRQSAIADTSVRVDVALLDDIASLVAELAVARDDLLRLARAAGDPALQVATGRVHRIVGRLQEGTLKTRLQPISSLWSRYPRVVRDLAIACGKKVRIEMDGSDTELDKAIIEAIKDPLTHLVRNAVDHGIERPDIRLAAGKPEEGRLVLRASARRGQVVVAVSDDGAGIDVGRIRARAIEMGIGASEGGLDLVFAPGLTTAETVTHVSGRGVGMDVVRTHVERIGGTVAVETAPGSGTTFTITIPDPRKRALEALPVHGVAAGASVAEAVGQTDLDAAVVDVWTSVLGLAVVPAHAASIDQPSMTGVVHISGDADGSVSLECPKALAAQAAAVMFGTTPELLGPGEVEDALGELTNVLGGRLKALLPGSNELWLPTVVEGTGYHLNVPGAVPVRNAWFSCEGQAIAVRVYERAAVVAAAS